MSAFATPPAGFIPPADLPAGKNTRALRCLHAGDWRITEKTYYPERVMPLHAHDDSNVTFFLSGAMDESFGRRREIARAGSWVTKPAGTEHANQVGKHGARVLEFVRTGGEPVPGLAYGWHHGGPEAITFLRIYRELRREEEEAPLVISELFGEIVSGPDEHRPGPAWIGRVRDRLHDAAGRIPSLGALAGAFDVHPTYLARAFRHRYGCSIGDYARKLRVERAARRLARRRPDSLPGIALAAGFADQSHLTRMFKSHTGLTPADYRDLIRD